MYTHVPVHGYIIEDREVEINAFPTSTVDYVCRQKSGHYNYAAFFPGECSQLLLQECIEKHSRSGSREEKNSKSSEWSRH